MSKSCGISIVIPAYNSAATIAETLESVFAQTFSNWEVVVVNDGSSDETAKITKSLAAEDSRIRVVSQPNSGASVARNTGIELAKFEWLLFLDADDWILPTQLEKLTSMISSNPKIGLAHCGWVRVTPDRELCDSVVRNPSGNLFDLLAEGNLFAIHSCVVRKSLVREVGNFDPTLRTLEDWDLWLRVARTGAYFSGTDEVLAYYRDRPGSLTTNGLQMFTDSMRVLDRIHAPDPRVKNPHQDYANGKSDEQLFMTKLRLAFSYAAEAIRSGNDFSPIFAYLRNEYTLGDIPNDKNSIRSFFNSLLLIESAPDNYYEMWQRFGNPLQDFVNNLEQHLELPGLSRRVFSSMARVILEETEISQPITICNTSGVQVEVTKPIRDCFLSCSTDRLHCTVELEGKRLGSIELPVFKGLVPSIVIADAIATEFAWIILYRFFQQAVYPSLIVEKESTGLVIRRNHLRLADELPEEEFWTEAHEQIGWTVFLQEIWNHPEWGRDTFYEKKIDASEQKTVKRQIVDTVLIVEISDELADIETSDTSLDVVVTVGGTAIGTFTIPTPSRYVSAHELRSIIITEADFELCRATVREGLLGQKFQLSSLRERLARVAATKKASVPNLTSNSARALDRVSLLEKNTAVISYRTQEAIDTSAARWAMLPVEAISELTELSLVAKESLIHHPQPNSNPELIFYLPDFVLPSSKSQWRTIKKETALDQRKAKLTNFYDRGYFEALYSLQPDPWDYTSPYEQTKYEQTLSLLPSEKIEQALELACAEGLFTVQLATHVDNLIAADISQVALERTAQRCNKLNNVSFKHLDFVKDPLPNSLDLIVCSEVLYFVGDREDLQTVARKFVDALTPGGYLLTAHANLVVDEPRQTGFNWNHPFGAKVIGETFASTSGLFFVKEICTPLYRIQLFQRHSFDLILKEFPEVIKAQHAPPNPDVAEMVLWNGGTPDHAPDENCTFKLPILMYHRVAPTGSSKTTPWRVTPESFEEQLCCLKDSGFYSVTLEDWRIAMTTRKPLPGRAVLLTFDDGYLDFLTYAFPLLKRYGFSATVFLVVDRIGLSNSWDRIYGEDVPLLGWEQIKQLQAEGIEFGSHTASHRLLTSLSPTEIVREAARSRAILERKLEVPIRAFAYPHGDFDPVVKHLVGACGYVFGLSCQSGRSSFRDSLLELPRIEIEGTDSLQDITLKFSS